MNKNNLDSSVNNYLNNTSLFRSNQRNRFISSYVSHRNYFAQHQQPKRINVSYLSNMTKSKKQPNFTPTQQVQLNSNTVNKYDELKATIKKEQTSQLLPIEQSMKMQIESKIIQMKVQPEPTRIKEEFYEVKEENLKINELPNIVQKLEKIQHDISIINSAVQDSRSNQVAYWQSRELVSPEPKQINPYLPSSVKRQQQQQKVYRTRNKEIILKKVESISQPPITPTSSLGIAESPQTFYLSSSPMKKKQQVEQRDHFVSIRRDMSGYLQGVKQKLSSSHASLQSIQCQFEVLIGKNLQLQCSKLKNALYRIIDQQIEDFKEYELRQFSKNKFYFMSGLYQLKCNIGRRLQEIEHYKLQLKNQQRWKNIASNILEQNYNENINFLLKKSQEIGKEMSSSIDLHLNDYSKLVSEEVVGKVRAGIKEEFIRIYIHFNQNNSKSKYYGFQNAH